MCICINMRMPICVQKIIDILIDYLSVNMFSLCTGSNTRFINIGWASCRSWYEEAFYDLLHFVFLDYLFFFLFDVFPLLGIWLFISLLFSHIRMLLVQQEFWFYRTRIVVISRLKLKGYRGNRYACTRILLLLYLMNNPFSHHGCWSLDSISHIL